MPFLTKPLETSASEAMTVVGGAECGAEGGAPVDWWVVAEAPVAVSMLRPA